MDETRHRPGLNPSSPNSELRLHPRAPLGVPALVDQPSLWPEPFEVFVENVSLGGASLSSRYLFKRYDFFHCRLMLPGTGAVAGTELRLAAVVVRVDARLWKQERRCGVGAFFVGVDPREEEAIQHFVQRQMPR